jgi:hypothetical protein
MAHADTVTTHLEEMIDQIERGTSMREMAEFWGIPVSQFWRLLRDTDEVRSARVAKAMEDSADGWVDRGLRTLLAARGDAAEIARARAIEQHCARRAAIRNPRKFGDKLEIDAKHSGGVVVTVAAAGPLDEAL